MVLPSDMDLSYLVVIAVGPCGKSLDAMQSSRKYSKSSRLETARFSEEKRRRKDEISEAGELSGRSIVVLRRFCALVSTGCSWFMPTHRNCFASISSVRDRSLSSSLSCSILSTEYMTVE